jgi:hypothetical protein
MKLKNDIVYLLKARVNDGGLKAEGGKKASRFIPKTVHKIGITDRMPGDRVREIRETGGPFCTVEGYTRKGKAAEVEANLHRLFKKKQWQFGRKFSGHTEFFDLSPTELSTVKRMLGFAFDLTRIDEFFMWAMFAWGVWAIIF